MLVRSPIASHSSTSPRDVRVVNVHANRERVSIVHFRERGIQVA